MSKSVSNTNLRRRPNWYLVGAGIAKLSLKIISKSTSHVGGGDPSIDVWVTWWITLVGIAEGSDGSASDLHQGAID